VYIGAGTNDPICSPQETAELEQKLLEAGAAVAVHWENYGHQLTSSEAAAAKAWFGNNFAK